MFAIRALMTAQLLKCSFPRNFSAIWSVAMPLQYSNNLRKSRPRIHRFTGYIAFTCSFTLALSGIAFIPRNLSFSDPIFNMHHVHGIPLFPSSNFALLFILSPAMVITGIRALYLAKNRRFDQHRQWAMYHGMIGYAIPLQRFYLLLSRIVGEILSNSPIFQESLGINQIKSVHLKSDAERAVFSATVWIGITSSLTWFIYSREVGKINKAKRI